MKNNVLITGAGGFIGSHCLEYWLDKTDWNFIIIDSFKHKGTYSRLDSLPNLDRNRIKIFQHDLSVPIDRVLENRILARHSCGSGYIDYIINIASDSAVERSITNPGQCWKNNCELIFNILEFARVVQPRLFLNINTDEIFAEQRQLDIKNGMQLSHHLFIVPQKPHKVLYVQVIGEHIMSQ